MVCQKDQLVWDISPIIIIVTKSNQPNQKSSMWRKGKQRDINNIVNWNMVRLALLDYYGSAWKGMISFSCFFLRCFHLPKKNAFILCTCCYLNTVISLIIDYCQTKSWHKFIVCLNSKLYQVPISSLNYWITDSRTFAVPA